MRLTPSGALARRLLCGGVVACMLAWQQPTRGQVTVVAQVRALVASARRDINSFWASRISDYVPPNDVVMVQAPTMTDCGPFEKPNARYCGSTHTIYWDLSLLTSLFRIGDFAPVFVLAHEWGHLVQQEIGSASNNGLLSIQIELQADCLAGTYAASARDRKVLDPGDDDEAALALRRAGDALDDAWFDSNAHGTAGQRIDAFSYGMEGRNCLAPGFMAFLKERGIDPTRMSQQQVAAAGGLASELPRQVSRFTLSSVKRVQVPESTDGVLATYRTSDGITATLVFLAFGSETRARAEVDASVSSMATKNGLREVRRLKLIDDAKREIGVMVVMRGALEYAVWNNGRTMAVVEGPIDVAFELADRLPF